MSDTVKRPYLQMMTIARAVAENLQPACHRIEIAGSLRRCKAEIGDIEIVAIPKLLPNLLGEPSEHTEVDALLASWPVALLLNGSKQKKFTLTGTSGQEYQVDLFLQPDPATWGMNFLIRTGSREFIKKMMTARKYGGYKPTEYEIDGARVWQDGVVLDTPEEPDVFRLWGMGYITPEAR